MTACCFTYEDKRNSLRCAINNNSNKKENKAVVSVPEHSIRRHPGNALILFNYIIYVVGNI